MLQPDKKTNYKSHFHCWEQGESPACGQKLENHKQCCLCDSPFPFPQDYKDIPKEWENSWKLQLELLKDERGIISADTIISLMKLEMIKQIELADRLATERTIKDILVLFVEGWEDGSIDEIKDYARSKGIIINDK